jgi:hypothetical protein
MAGPAVWRGVVVVRSKGPLRRRLFCGGCSRVEYQQVAAACVLFLPSTDFVSWNGGVGVRVV